MWLITNFGFFSVVEKPEQKGSPLLTIRARAMADLEELKKRYIPDLGEIQTGGGTDYKYRAVADRDAIANAFAKAIRDINYSNFKNSVAANQGHDRARLYHDLWSVLMRLQQHESSPKPGPKKPTTNRKTTDPGKAAESVHPLPGPFDDDISANQWARCVGALVGLAVGDAVGTTVEFKKPGTFALVTDMVGGGPFRLKPGEWTDDTSMALCLAESLATLGRFDPVDQLQRYVRWWKEGHLSSTGACFDIGNQTRDALAEFKATGKPQNGPTGQYNAGNGSLMRLAPVAMAYWGTPGLAIDYTGESSKTTHGNPECVDACRYFAALLVGAIHGRSKQELLGPAFSSVDGLWTASPLTARVAAVAAGSYHLKKPPAIRGTGYVVECLEAALWAFATTSDFESAILAAVNLGDDADTTAAVCGQLAGAFYGMKAIPRHWLEKLAKRDTIMKLATALTTMGSKRIADRTAQDVSD